MSAYNPPIQNVPIFDTLLFTDPDEILTRAEADRSYLKFPLGQGTETIPALVVNGTTTINATDTNTDAVYYPVFAGSTSAEILRVDKTTGPFSVNPNTGALKLASNIDIETLNNLKSTGNSSTGKVAIGVGSGSISQGSGAVAIGINAGQNTQGGNSIAIGSNAGQISQAGNCVAICVGAGSSSQGGNAVAIGGNAGQTSQGGSSVAIGYLAGSGSQGGSSIAIGNTCGNSNQGSNSVAVGFIAGRTSQGSNCVAIGNNSGNSSQGGECVAVGKDAGTTSQGANSVAVGQNSGNSGQGITCVAIGHNAGSTSQSTLSVAIGGGAGRYTQGGTTGGAVAIGYQAGIGVSAGNFQAEYAVAIGYQAGASDSGASGQRKSAIAIGEIAGRVNQGTYAVAIGGGAGNTSQGDNAIAIGKNAGNSGQTAGSIVINATGTALNGAAAGCYIDPIRSGTGTNILAYDTTTKELFYTIPSAPASIFYSATLASNNTLGSGSGSIGGFSIASLPIGVYVVNLTFVFECIVNTILFQYGSSISTAGGSAVVYANSTDNTLGDLLAGAGRGVSVGTKFSANVSQIFNLTSITTLTPIVNCVFSVGSSIRANATETNITAVRIA